MKLLKIDAEVHTDRVDELLHRNSIGIESIQKTWNRVGSCRKLRKEGFSLMLSEHDFRKKGIRIEEKRCAVESATNQKKVNIGLKGGNQMRPREIKMWPEAAKKEIMLHPMNTRFFRTLEGVVRLSMSWTSGDSIFRRKDWPNLQKWFPGFVHSFDEAAETLKITIAVVYSGQAVAVPLDLSNNYGS